MTTRFLLPAAVLLCGCGLRHQPMAPQPARGPARDSLIAFDQSRTDSVMRRGLADGMASFFGPAVAYLRAGVPVVYGIDVVREFLAASPPANPSWAPLGGGVSDDLRSGYTWGIAAHAGTPHAPVQLERYIAYWQRSGAQPWRIIAYAEIGSAPIAEISVTPQQTTPPATPLPRPLEESRSHVRDADSLFSDLSYRMGAAFAFASTIADDGTMFGSPALLTGPNAVKEYFETRGEPASLTWQPVFASIAGSRDLGFTIGESVTTARGPSGAAVQRFGKYLTVWRKQRDGTWKFLVDGGNASPGPVR
jgi:ketosteroid isomerase-like protein